MKRTLLCISLLLSALSTLAQSVLPGGDTLRAVYRVAPVVPNPTFFTDSLWYQADLIPTSENGRPSARVAQLITFEMGGANNGSWERDRHYFDPILGRDTLLIHDAFRTPTAPFPLGNIRQRALLESNRIRTEFLQVDSLSQTITQGGGSEWRDTQGRTFLVRDSFLLAPGNWYRMLRKFTYQGAERLPWRKEVYRNSVLDSIVDSATYDIQNRPLFFIYKNYATTGDLEEKMTAWMRYSGDSVVALFRILNLVATVPSVIYDDNTFRFVQVRQADTVFYRWYTLTDSAEVLTREHHSIHPLPVYVPFIHPGTATPYMFSHSTNLAQMWCSSDSTAYDHSGLPIYTNVFQATYPCGRSESFIRVTFERYPAQLLTSGRARALTKPAHITLAPNPATSTLTIQSSQPISHLILINAVGQQFNVKVEGNRASIGHLPKGLYHVMAYSQGRAVGTSGVVKE